ncbi:non-ribosomal peptide synthetase [Anaerocolumna xylanovorans]|uniref:Amino acid adenylation domain-containing protein n=1 Tax=Anaerocolumna xylanovorans DSM 12503 TaxID=1121345 RepID=A0A1M7XZS5_9FIRM|nr:non-ribosomal peptide synthetase [Anaerocolumna xylanovorans]SHO44490.1 amino acid adenylation domain-containing protein [Anaerocolumna xylanovorans DSM 12503]
MILLNYNASEIGKRFELSQGQKDLWNYSKLNADSTAYNVPMSYYVQGNIEPLLLKEAIEEVVSRHAVFTTRFIEDENGHAMQEYHNDSVIEVELLERELNKEQIIENEIKKEAKIKFILEEGNLARFKLYRAKDNTLILMINIHHIIFDGLSINILLKDIKDTYTNLYNGNEKRNNVSSDHYPFFVQWQEEMIKNDIKGYEYWAGELKHDIPSLPLPRKKKAGTKLYQGGLVRKEINIGIKEKAEVLCKELGISSYAFILSIYHIALKKYKEEFEAAILSPFVNRLHKEYENDIGFFVNMIMITKEVMPKDTFASIASAYQDKIFECLQYGYYPLQSVRKKTGADKIGNAVLYYQNWVDQLSTENEEGELIKLIHIPTIYQEGEFEAVFEILELSDRFIINCRYDQNAYTQETMNELCNQFTYIMEQVTQNPKITYENIKNTDDFGKNSLIDKWNDTFVPFDKNSRIYDLIDANSLKYPNDIAITCGQDKISYQELMQRSDRFCAYLKGCKVNSKDVIGICMSRSINIIIAMLGIMKADAIYLPVDMLYPEERIRYMLTDSQAKFVITDCSTQEQIGKLLPEDRIIDLGQADKAALDPVQQMIPRVNDVVYVLYTSGSTGKPKGVQVLHQGLYNSLVSFAKKPGFTKDDSLLAITTVCFDIAQLEIFLPLIMGGRLEFTEQHVLDDMEQLMDKLQNSDTNVFQSTPATLKALLSNGWRNEKKLKVLCGGEELSRTLARELLLNKVELWNMYGPTETTIWSTISKVEDADNITIGRPIDNTQIYILDENKNMLPIGEEGELYISGSSVAKGYLGKEELTNERFVENPFHHYGNKMYRTGDLAKYLDNGEIKYCGRMDAQVKIRGYRIELQEIEFRLKEIKGVNDAVAVVREDIPGKKMIVAFMIYHAAKIKEPVLSNELLKWLPRYMIPVKYIALNHYPTTLNAKIDRKSLSERNIQELLKLYGSAKIAEKTVNYSKEEEIIDKLKEEIAACMQDMSDTVLELNEKANVGEYGFDSITFHELSKRMNGKFGTDINPTIFYSYGSIEEIAQYLHNEYREEMMRHYHSNDTVRSIKDQLPKGDKVNKVSGGEEKAEIAIVGMSGRFPDSDNLDEFWDNLINNRNMVQEVPLERWDWRECYGDSSTEENKTNSKWGGFIHDVDKFDNTFFGISPREAELMDPQQRIILECVWKTLEDAGHKANDLRGCDMGVFIGSTGSDYMGMMNKIDGYTLTGVAKSVIANRVSYLYDWHGPSEPVDTACSSSLVAVHRAVMAISNGECTQAIAGGVNIMLNPFAYIASSKVGMLSETGACKTFDKDADGYVRGEGVGTIYLKRLDKAIEDHDQIYAVVKATVENHGGKANSLTAPNPNAQAGLLAAAYKKAHVDPRLVSYIETHGTGTSLGDPIEVNGLKSGFQTLYEKNGLVVSKDFTCGLGSVKVNIGHLEAAAGIASLIKVLLSLKYKYIPSNIHLKEQNPYINLADSPFYLIREGKEWEPVIIDGKALPRLAGISSFGFGGVNAHVILEEYAGQRSSRGEEQESYIIPLSAKNKNSLLETAEKLLEFLRNDNHGSLKDIAFTLQDGREEMKYRAVFVVHTTGELMDGLKAYIQNENYAENEIEHRLQGLPLEENLEEKLRTAKKWLSGETIPWNQYYDMEQNPPWRISLPAYSFCKERFWFEDVNQQQSTEGLNEEPIKPYMPGNATYTESLDPGYSYLSHHRVGEEIIVPGAFQIETARKYGALSGKRKVSAITEIMFYQRLPILERKEIKIDIVSEQDKATYSIQDKESGEIYSQGRYLFDEKSNEAKIFNINDIMNDLDVQKAKDECYLLFDSYQFHYGPVYQVIETISYNENSALSKLSIPMQGRNDLDGFTLHPSIMDGALQTVLVLLGADKSNGTEKEIYFPFSIERIDILSKPMKECLVYAREILQNNKNIRKFDLYIMNSDGEVLVAIKNYLIKKVAFKPKNVPEVHQKVYLKEAEREDDVIFNHDIEVSNTVIIHNDVDFHEKAVKDQNLKSVFPMHSVGEEDFALIFKEVLTENSFIQNIVVIQNNPIWSDDGNIERRRMDEAWLQNLYRPILRVLRALLRNKLIRPINFIVIHQAEDNRAVTAFSDAIGGMLKSVSLENPLVKTALIKYVGIKQPTKELLKIAMTEASYGIPHQDVIYRNEVRSHKVFEQIGMIQKEDQTINIGKDDIVIITGGAGKLGLLFGSYLTNTWDAKVILCGRRKEEELSREEQDCLNRMQSKVTYISADVTKYEEAENLVTCVKERYGKITGIIHAAGLIRDSYLMKKGEEDFFHVLSPKILGVVNLDLASKDESLKYFIMFSSVSALAGNAGQSDYAMGNCFLDHFIKHRNELVSQDKRCGKSSTINWTLWKNGGMQVVSFVKDSIFNQWGIHELDNENGLEMFHKIIASGETQVLPLLGDSDKINHVFLEKKSPKIRSRKGGRKVVKNENLKYSLEDYLKHIIAGATKLSLNKLSSQGAFDEYGIDSVIIMDLNKELSQIFGELPKTLFFEYNNIEDLAEYLMKSNEETVIKQFGKKESDSEIEMIESSDEYDFSVTGREENSDTEKQTDDWKVTENENRLQTDIAVIGLSGIFPMADNMDDFWNNLMEGRDCITEVPKERWDYKKYYDKEKGVRGKSYTKWGSFLDDIDKFDPLFFGISPMEAEMLDPQERLFMETVYHAMEDSGYTKDSLKDSNVGVYVGVMWGQYQLYGANPLSDGTVIVPASSYASIANRISYFFNFRGPSIALDTMCSSSLTAIHLACNSIISGELDLAVAGGVNLTVHPNKHVFLSQTKFASSDGRCRSFGEGGDGYVPGEAIGAIILKPLGKAIKDGDNIYGVIKGTSINHGGRSNGYTVPNVKQQASVIKEVYEKYNINPRTVNYIEAHGTGTALGDPIELSSMTNAFRQYTKDRHFCSIGSVKSNIGHCESAAGIVGIIKILLQMKYKKLVPSIHSKKLNKNTNFDETPFHVQQIVEDWKQVVLNENGEMKQYPRRAAINSFGAGGANSHILLEEYTKNEVPSTEEENLFVFSAKDKNRLLENVKVMLAFLDNPDDGNRQTLILHKVLEILSKQIDIDMESIDKNALISEYLITPNELMKMIDSVNTEFSQMSAFDINTLIDHPSITEVALEIEQRLTREGKVGWNTSSGDIGSTNKVMPVRAEVSMKDVAYTLQIGREAMNERLAVLAGSISELRMKLQEYAAGNTISEGIYAGNTKDTNHLVDEMISDEEGQAFLRNIMRNRRFGKLAVLWTSGVDIEWEELYRSRKCKKVSLPGYAFRKDVCWLPEELLEPRVIASGNAGIAMETAEAKRSYPDTSGMIYRPRYKKADTKPVEVKTEDKNILVVYEDSDLSRTMVRELRHRVNDSCVWSIELGKSNQVRQDNQWSIDVNDRNGFSLAADHLTQIDEIYFLALHKFDFDSIDLYQSFHEFESVTIVALHRLVKMLEERDLLTKELEFILITNNSCMVGYESSYNAFGAALLGFMKVFAKEYNKVRTLFIDLEQEEVSDKATRDLFFSLSGTRGSLQSYALRMNEVYQFVLEEVEMPNITRSRLVEHGVYVVLGGSGNVGEKLCSYLSEEVKANIVVVGRSEYSEKIKRIEEAVHTGGGEFVYLKGDIAKYEDMKEVFAAVMERFGTINGVFDLAMLLNYSPINTLTEENLLSELSTKVKGSVVLGKVIEEYCKYCIDFVTFFSSGEAFTGNPGWSTYAQGCCFEDLYARYLRDIKDIPAIVINWGFWDKEGDPYIEKYKDRGIRPLTKEIGMNLLEQVLSCDIAQVMALDVEPKIRSLMGVDESKKVEIYTKLSAHRSKLEQVMLKLMNEANSWEELLGHAGQLAGQLHCKIAFLSDRKQNSPYLEDSAVDVIKEDELNRIEEQYYDMILADLDNITIDFSDINLIKMHLKQNGILLIGSTADYNKTEICLKYLRVNGFGPVICHSDRQKYGIIISDGKAVNDKKPKAEKGNDLPGKRSEEREKVPQDVITEVTMDSIKTYIKQVFSRILKLDEDRFDDHTDFTEFGVDSLIITDIHKEFEKDLGKLVVTLLAENNTIEKLANYFMKNSFATIKETLNPGMHKIEEKDISEIEIPAFKIINSLEESDIPEYLKNYGNLYRSGELRTMAKQREAQAAVNTESDKMVHMLVMTKYHAELEVFIIGRGIPLLFIPAIGLTAPTWINQIEKFKDKYQLIIIHHPGYGLSGIQDDIGGETVVLAFADVLDQLGINKVHLVASCFGGIAGQQFAFRYPERTASVILCGAFYKNFGLPNISIEDIPIDKMSEATQMVAGGIVNDFDKIISKNPAMEQVFNEARELLLNSQCVNALVVMRYIGQILTVNTNKLLISIKAPTLCVAGSEDTIVDINDSKYISQSVVNGSYQEIEGAGHYPYLTHQEEFNEIMQEFLTMHTREET